MQEVFLSFFSLFENYKTLPVAAQIHLKYCFFQIVTPNFLFQALENLENFARVKLY